MVEVIQADRDAAATYADEHWLWPAPTVSLLRNGGPDWDNYHLTVAFATARIAAMSTLQAQCERQRVALERLVYETTHLSPCKPNGDHDCTISAGTLAFARTVLALAAPASLDGEKA